MKRLALITTLLATGLSGAYAQAPARAQQAATYIDQARVHRVDPQYEEVNVPRQECRTRWINEDRYRGGEVQDRHYGGALVGGVAGGLLGNQVGGGSGRDVATALGAVIGAFTGDQLANRDRRGAYENSQREVQRCRTVYDTQSQITGYRVAYEYQGQNYTTFMRSHPGRSLQVRVSVDPIEQ